SPVLAQSGQTDMSAICPLSGVKRTTSGMRSRSARTARTSERAGSPERGREPTGNIQADPATVTAIVDGLGIDRQPDRRRSRQGGGGASTMTGQSYRVGAALLLPSATVVDIDARKRDGGHRPCYRDRHSRPWSHAIEWCDHDQRSRCPTSAPRLIYRLSI